MKVVITALIVVMLAGLIWYNNDTNDAQTYAPHQPVISRQDILNASDLVDGVKQALINQDDDAIDGWLDKAEDLAQEADLPAEDVDYITSENARKYVIFLAKRQLFNDAVEQAYYTLFDIDAIKAQYPEAQDLYSKADDLIAQRNKILEKIASEIAQGQTLNDDFRRQALAMWKQRFADKIKTKQ